MTASLSWFDLSRQIFLQIRIDRIRYVLLKIGDPPKPGLTQGRAAINEQPIRVAQLPCRLCRLNDALVLHLSSLVSIWAMNARYYCIATSRENASRMRYTIGSPALFCTQDLLMRNDPWGRRRDID